MDPLGALCQSCLVDRMCVAKLGYLHGFAHTARLDHILVASTSRRSFSLCVDCLPQEPVLRLFFCLSRAFHTSSATARRRTNHNQLRAWHANRQLSSARTTEETTSNNERERFIRPFFKQLTATKPLAAQGSSAFLGVAGP